MKLKKTLLMACCVIIASLGITLTGCSNSSSDKNAESTSEIVESTSGNDAESSSDTDAESTSGNDAESSSDTNAESDGDIDLNDENLYLGTWKATVAISTEGDSYDYTEDFEFTFNADHTVSVRQDDEVDDGGTWELAEGGVKIMDPHLDPFILTYKDGELVWDLEQLGGSIYFAKKN